MARSNTTELVFLPLGGVGEIGMNLAMYGFILRTTVNGWSWIWA